MPIFYSEIKKKITDQIIRDLFGMDWFEFASERFANKTWIGFKLLRIGIFLHFLISNLL